MTKQERKLSALHPAFQHYPLRLGRAIQKSSFFRSLNIRGKVIETLRSFQRSCFLWGKGRTKEDFNESKIGSYDSMADPDEKKVTWLSHPRYSTHIQGIAFDMALGIKHKGGIKQFLWGLLYGGKTIYKEMGNIADSLGLKSLSKTYGEDHFHFELASIFQGTHPLCYGFVVINALQKMYSKWRNIPKNKLVNMAIKLGNEVIKRGMARSTLSALIVAKEWGWAKDWKVIKVKDLKSQQWWNNQPEKACHLVSQRYNASVKNGEDGQGISAHTYLFHGNFNGKTWFVNSHYDNPIINLTDKTQLVEGFELVS